MKDRAHSIFRSAQVYEKAARSLNAGAGNDSSLLLPSVVNAALSLELYFKSLYVLEKGKEFKLKGQHSHDFDALFKQLSDGTKHQLTERFNSALTSRDMSDVKRIESMLRIVIPRDFQTNVAEWATIFTNLRYVYHFMERQKEKQKTMMFFPEIADSIASVISDREPTWMP